MCHLPQGCPSEGIPESPSHLRTRRLLEPSDGRERPAHWLCTPTGRGSTFRPCVSAGSNPVIAIDPVRQLVVRARLDRVCWGFESPSDHFLRILDIMARRKYTDEQLVEAVKESNNWSEVCRHLGAKPATGSQTHIANRARSMGLSTDHFKSGRNWRKGKKFPPKQSLEELLRKDSQVNSSRLRKRLIGEGLKQPICEICQRSTWNGEPIPLELDHKNSDHWDNRLENLMIVCPNCHAQETKKRNKRG